MGRKKRRGATLKPFCYYCDREFDDEKVLIQHQKAKHFKCSQCARKLDTATGLAVHLLQVHKEQITRVPNALSGRDAIEVIVHGMEGVPQETIDERLSRQTKKNEGKESQKRQRVNWAQVTMAPTSMEQFALQAQQGILPTFVGLPSLVPPDPATAPALGGVSLPFPPPLGVPGLAPSLPAPPNIQGLLGPAAASVSAGMGGPTVPNATPALALLGGLGLDPTTAVGAAAAAGRAATATGTAAASMTGAPGGPAGTAGAAAPLPPGRPPTNFSAPPLPANVSLMYNDDMISMEERRAHETCAYVGEAMA